MEYLTTAFEAFKSDDAKIKKSGIGGILAVLSILLIPAFFIQGYYVKILQATENPSTSKYPEWDNWGELFVNGLIAFIISFVLMLPTYILIYGPQLNGMDGNTGTAFILVGNLTSIVLSYFIPIIYALYFREGFDAVTDFSRVTDIAFASDYIIAYILVMVVSIAFGIASVAFAILTLGVGILLLPFLFFAFQAIVMYTLGSAITAVDPGNTKPDTYDASPTEATDEPESEFVA